MHNILIFGASGLLGSKFYNYYKKIPSCEVFGTSSKYTQMHDLVQVEVTDLDEVEILINKVNPRIVINCVALTNLEMCNSNIQLAKKVNSEFPKFLANISTYKKFKLIQISTDNFKTKINELRDEKCSPIPTNFYSESKLDAEIGVLNLNPSSIIVRCNFFGLSTKYLHNSLLEWALNSFKNEKQINGYININFNPVSAKTLVEIIHQLISRDLSGIVNVGSNEILSKFEFLYRVQDLIGVSTNLVKPAIYENVMGGIDRPLNMALNLDYLRDKLRILIPPISDMIETALQN